MQLGAARARQSWLIFADTVYSPSVIFQFQKSIHFQLPFYAF